MGGRVGERPLLESTDPLAALERLLATRRTCYEAAADLVVDTEQLDIQQVTEQIAASLSLFPGNSVMPGGT
jgi:shikimate kinase